MAYNERVITVGMGWVLLACAISRFSGYIKLAYCSTAKGDEASTNSCVYDLSMLVFYCGGLTASQSEFENERAYGYLWYARARAVTVMQLVS